MNKTSMSIQLIQQYYSNVERLIRYGGTRNESSLRKAFQELLDHYARSKNLVLVPEVGVMGKRGRTVHPDGTLKDALRQDWGYWESKDEKDTLADEIDTKFSKGYPDFNILFEDTHLAILIQGGNEILRAEFEDARALDVLLTRFVSYEPTEVREFHKAIELFSAEVGGLAEALRAVISEQVSANSSFRQALDEFLELAKKAINPKIEMADVREMIIQHVLTEDIFMRVFDEAEFHRENVIAHKLAEVAGTFYHGETKRNIHARIAPYYETINARASQISDHHEKQKFLKALYESFYKAYNPKAADRLGIVYTPDEIVRFMIESTDYLTYKHFGKTLGDKGVEILDPATGTGTFITELIEYLPPQQLEYKYDNELHCNEVSILPYYIANLNIEYTYKQKTGKFNEFENICFVDTLDNMGFEHTGKQLNFFGITDANTERIVKQNSKPIMLVIGNPPYNAHQESENENNRNRTYPQIDKRIKDTYVANTNAQKVNYYDMYIRFYRWATDRLSKNGVLCFITNNSFIDGFGYDGFRKVLGSEFNEIWIVDLGGNALKRETGNIFGIKVGVAIAFLVKNEAQKKSIKIYYKKIGGSAKEKLNFLAANSFAKIDFEQIVPDKKFNWINQTSNDYDSLMPVFTKDGKSIFGLYSNGTMAGRDEWVYDFSKKNLENKSKFFIDEYNHEVARWIRFRKENNYVDIKAEANPVVDKFLQERNVIKWSKMIKRDKLRKDKLSEFDKSKIRVSLYRPFVKQYLYFDYIPIDLKGQDQEIFPTANSENQAIWIKNGSDWNFLALGINVLSTYLPQGGSTCFPIHHYAESGERLDNITDWALGQFQKRYGKGGSRSTPTQPITKEDIFHYVYGVLHHPAYRTKYEINLKREFPRIPFYQDFHQWAAWGKRLMELHLNYESVQPYPLERGEREGKAATPNGVKMQPTCRLIAHKEQGIIEVDTATTLRGVPAEAWEYRLGTYSALEWILERYKEKKPKDPTIAEKFHTYRFADYKEQVIDLLMRVCTVSMETMKIVKDMP